MTIHLNKKTESELRRKLIGVTDRLYDRGFNTLFSGNVSTMITRNLVLMTPAGLPKKNLTKEMISMLDLKAARLVNGPRYSSEYKIHMQIYGSMPDVNAIIHAHPESSLALFEARGRSAFTFETDEEVGYYMGKMGFVARMKSGSTALAEAVAEQVFKHNATIVLMEGHGTVAIGRNLDEALGRIEALEKLSKKKIIIELLKKS